MSRHPFHVGGERWTVGFDPPLSSFYAQVEPHPDTDPGVVERFRARWPQAGAEDPDDLLVTVVGDTPAQVRTVAGLARVLAEHATALPAAMTARLLSEQPAGSSAAPAAPPAGARLPGADVDRVVGDARAALAGVMRSFPRPPGPDGQPLAAAQVEGTRPGSAAAPCSTRREEGRGR